MKIFALIFFMAMPCMAGTFYDARAAKFTVLSDSWRASVDTASGAITWTGTVSAGVQTVANIAVNEFVFVKKKALEAYGNYSGPLYVDLIEYSHQDVTFHFWDKDGREREITVTTTIGIYLDLALNHGLHLRIE